MPGALVGFQGNNFDPSGGRALAGAHSFSNHNPQNSGVKASHAPPISSFTVDLPPHPFSFILFIKLFSVYSVLGIALSAS